MATARTAHKRTNAVTSTRDWRTWLLLLGVLFGYTSVNLLLRNVAGNVPATVVAMWRLTPLFAYAIVMNSRPDARAQLQRVARFGDGQWKAVLGLVAGGISSHVIGNTIFQLSLGLGGVGLAVPASQGGVIGTALLLGAFWFKERPAPQRIIGTLTMIGGIVVISWQHGLVMGESALLGVLVGAAAGGCWALSSVMLRYAYDFGFTPTSGQLINSGAGFIILLSISLMTVGWQGVIPENTYMLPMLLAGIINAATLTFIAMAVQRTEVVIVNMFSAGSLALSTLAAIWLFQEPWSGTLGVGLLLTVGGLIYAQVAGARK